MRNILITGLSGFVGSNLKNYLSEVSNLNLSAYNRGNSSLNLIDTDAIVHLAGKAHDLKNVSRPEDYYEANFELTKKLYDAFLLSNVKKFIFISSVKASADIFDGILSEDDDPIPKTHYGKSKLMAEEYIRSIRLPEGKSFYILRPCMIHGPGNKGNLNLLYKLVSKGLPWPLGAFKNKRSFCSIDNLLFIFKELIEREDIPSGIYNVADNEPISTNSLISLIAESINKRGRIFNISPSIINLIAKFGDIIKLPLNSERLVKLTQNYVVSNQKLLNAIGKELPVNAMDGMKKTLRSFNKIL
jgi:nucleoside-diphosphate-sugar epimerase